MSPAARAPAFLAVDWCGTVVPFFGRPPYEGALPCLEALLRSGLHLAVVSCAAPDEIRADVRRIGLRADEIHGCPDKLPVLQELACRLGHGALVGDHPADLRAASDAGLEFIQARPEDQALLEGARHSFLVWPELPDLLGMDGVALAGGTS